MTDKAALSLLLRSKTALVRLVDAEVADVLAFLESIGFVHQSQVVAPIESPPADPATISAPPA